MSEKEIAEVEAIIGHRLPPSYRAWLLAPTKLPVPLFTAKALLKNVKKEGVVSGDLAVGPVFMGGAQMVLRVPAGAKAKTAPAEWALNHRFMAVRVRYKSFAHYIAKVALFEKAKARRAKASPSTGKPAQKRSKKTSARRPAVSRNSK